MPHTLTAVVIFGSMLAAAEVPEQQSAVVKQFHDRVNSYLTARTKAIKGVPALKPQSSAEQIQTHSKTLGAAVRAGRAAAAQGEVFTPEIKKYFLHVIQSEMRGKDGRSAKKAAQQGNPTSEGEVPVVVKVNAPYPENASLSTVPSTLLQRLPQLPKQLDFRFVGRYLILRDTQANLIVDFISNAIP